MLGTDLRGRSTESWWASGTTDGEASLNELVEERRLRDSLADGVSAEKDEVPVDVATAIAAKDIAEAFAAASDSSGELFK